MKEINILLVEDNPHDVFLVKTILEDQGIPYKLHVVGDGEAAIAFVKRMGRLCEEDGPPCPDLLLLDINLPRVNGLKVLSEFRGHPECAHTPVIVFSSSLAPEEQKRLAELRVSRFFKKPSDYDEFAELGCVVREVVGG